MFTLLRNFRAMFMFTVMGSLQNAGEASEGSEVIDAALQDDKLNLSEIKDLTDLPAEIQATVLEGLAGELELTTDIASGLGDINLENATEAQKKTVQFIIKLNQLAQGASNFLVDGLFQRGSKAALTAIVPSYDGGVITQAVIGELIAATNTKLTERADAADAEAAAEAAALTERQNALSLVASYGSVEEIQALGEDARKDVQRALQTLNYYTKGIDGQFGRGSIAAYDAAQADVQSMELDNAEADLAAANARIEEARRIFEEAMGQIPDTLEGEEAEITASIGSVDARIAELMNERDDLSLIPDQRAVEVMEEEITDMIDQLLDMKSRLEESLDRVQSGEGQLTTLDRDVRVAEAEGRIAERNLETIQQDVADEADVYSRLEMDDTPTAEEVKDALKNDPEGKLLLCQLQADLKLLKDEEGKPLYTGAIDGHKGIDYAYGPGTESAVGKALTLYGSLTAIRRAARIAEVARESSINTGTGRTNQGIDLVAQTDGYESGDLEAFLAEYKVTENMPESVREGTESEQQAWVIGQAIEMGDRENASKTRLTFIDGLSDAGNDRVIAVMAELRANFETMPGQAELIQSMMNGVDISASDFVNGEVGSDTFAPFELGGRIIDTGLLDSAYIATGSEQTADHDGAMQRGTMEVPIWNADGSINEKFAELDFENATYINGAIVMTMKNGCEGNLVIIPVQREKYVPPVVVPRAPAAPTPRRTPSTPVVPGQPPIVLVPVDTPNTGVRTQCGHGRYSGDWISTPWTHTPRPGFGVLNDYTDGVTTILVENAARCDSGGSDTPSSGTPDRSTPSNSDASDEGGGGADTNGTATR